ncbi:MAG: glycosyltransferase family 4 protein [Candidatus Hodarchaeota archaeon]
MKIAWFTPFSEMNGISRYSRLITQELVNRCNVDLWISEDSHLLPTELKIFHYHSHDDLSRRLNQYDFLVYNMGNNLDFHKDIYEISKKQRGIIILHDVVMHHFFAGYYLTHKQDQNGYAHDMERLYGKNGKIIATKSLTCKCVPIWETEEVIKYPFFEKAIEGAIGVISHSYYAINKMRLKFSGVAEVLYHPCIFDRENTSVNRRKADLGIPEDKILMVTVGHVNPNKRIDKVIEIFGKKKDIAQKAFYCVIGPKNQAQYIELLQSLIKKYKLYNSVKLLGFQSDAIVSAYMQNADIFLNLRFPAIEAASWSLVEQLSLGKPAIVTDTGFYAEIPDDCVIKVKRNNEKKDIYRALKRLMEDEQLRNVTGTKAKNFVLENFTIDQYRDKIFAFLKKLGNSKSVQRHFDAIG